MQPGFRYSAYPQEIIFGAGSFDQLRDAMERYGWSRALLITSSSQRANGQIERVERILGDLLVGLVDHVQQHVPAAQVAEAMRLAKHQAADVLIALGGGSAIGVAKATSSNLEAFIFDAAAPRTPISNRYVSRPLLPIIAIPTTYAGSELTPFFGVTRERDGVKRKETSSNPLAVPRVVLYDPRLTFDLPRETTAATGINALAHCVEAVYSITRNPLSTAGALEGARRIYAALPRCAENGNDVEARAEMLTGSYLAGAALSNVAMGLHHGVCHVLGGTAGIPHGVANAIMLPHAMRFNAEACAAELAPLAAALGVAHGQVQEMARAAAGNVAALVAGLGLPSRLRDVGVREPDLPRLAQFAFANKTVQNNPKKIGDMGEIEELLREAW